MKAYIKEFNYPDSKTGISKARRVFVLNEDVGRIGGIDLESVSDEELNTLTEMFKEKDISDFSRKPKDPNAPKSEAPRIGVYKAYSKSKIIEPKIHVAQ